MSHVTQRRSHSDMQEVLCDIEKVTCNMLMLEVLRQMVYNMVPHIHFTSPSLPLSQTLNISLSHKQSQVFSIAREPVLFSAWVACVPGNSGGCDLVSVALCRKSYRSVGPISASGADDVSAWNVLFSASRKIITSSLLDSPNSPSVSSGCGRGEFYPPVSIYGL